MNQDINRRDAIKRLATSTAAIAATAGLSSSATAEPQQSMTTALKGNIHHSVCRWCFKKFSLEELCENAARIGLESVELVNLEETKILREHGLTSALLWGQPGGIKNGFNRIKNHDALVDFYEEIIPDVAKGGFKTMICFSGNRDGMSDEEGLENCAKGIKRVMPVAEKHGVTLVMELLNSKRNHPDYMCDFTSWGVELCKAVGSESFKLLYDIYHMQIMEGDLIDTIKEFHPYIGHYHTAGVPGRHELDDTQEIYYPAIMRAIVDTGYKGFVGHEFIPKRDPFTSLEEAVKVCDV